MTFRSIQIWVLLLCSVFTVATFAQNSNSTIKGTVQDVSGAVVPGATISLTNVGTGQTLTTTSKSDGFYTFTNLSPANYKVSVTMQGFAQWVGVLTLRVSQDAEVDPKVTAASVSTQVTVHDVTPVIDRVNPTISDVKNATAIETQPIQSRNILSVIAFSPGVVANNVGGSGAGNTRINGMPPGSVDFLVDGQSMANRNTNELQVNAQPSPTYQEVKVITSNGNAQYGAPGIVELVTKSGTNQFHGQIYELNQNNHLQATSYYKGPSVKFLQHNEYGAQLGGPIWFPKIYNGRNKTFFFVDLEWIKQNANQAEQYTVPTLSERKGDLSTVFAGGSAAPITLYDPLTTIPGPPYTRSTFAGNIIPSDRLNPVTQKILGVTPVPGFTPFPFPNINVSGQDVATGTPNYIPTTAKATVNNKLYTFKVDQLFGPNRLAARYTYTDSKILAQHSYSPQEPDLQEQGGHNGSLTFTQIIGPRAINVAHVGVQYDDKDHAGPMVIPNVAPSVGLPVYQTNSYWPQFYFDDYSNTDYYWTGADRQNPKDYPDQTISASDQFSYNKGNHQLMFGFDFNNFRLNTKEIGQPGGDYNTTGYYTAEQDPASADGVPLSNTGSGLADFLLGEMDQLHVNYYPNYNTRQTQYDGYAQDDWRVSQKLTLNVGLRYEYWTAFSDASGRASTFDPNIPGGMVVYQGSGALPSGITQDVYNAFVAAGLPIESAAKANYPLSLFNMPKNNFDPRVGFAYQLDSKTVLRGGYGIYRFPTPVIAFQQATRANAPFSYSATYGNGLVDGTIPNNAAAELEFPNAQPQYGGPQPINQFMLGNQGCANQPAGTCVAPGFALVNGGAGGSLSVQPSGGFGANFLDPNYKLGLVQEYSLTLSQELPYHTGFQLSYIGNHSTNLLMVDPINALLPRDLCTTPDGTNCSRAERSLYPVFGNPIQEFTYDGYSNTNELQAQLTHTWGNGLTLQSYFTWMKSLTTSEFGFKNGGPPGANSGNSSTNTMVPAALTTGYDVNTIGSGASRAERLRAVYANDPALPAKTFQMDGHYQLPFGKNQRYLANAHGIVNALVSGYNISAFYLWHSGFYFSPFYSPFNGTRGGQAINLSPGKTGILPPGQRTSKQWFDASVYDPTSGLPYAGQTYTLGTTLQGDFRNNVPAYYMTGPGYNKLDATVYKLTPIWRDLVFDFEAQFINAYNHANLGAPTTNGNITKLASGSCINGDCPRTVQLQAKIIF